MTAFSRNIRPFVDAELQAARELSGQGRADDAFRHLERAHVLGQASTWQHVRVHVRMLAWGLRQRQAREIAGQLLRIAGAASLTAIGKVPEGNTGGANVSPRLPMPIPDDLAALIRKARG